MSELTTPSRPESGPKVVAAACIVRGERVLLARRYQPSLPSAHNRWELPGGKVIAGETPEQTVRREIVEELGLSVQVVRLLPHIQSNVYERPSGGTSQFIVVAYECVARPGARPSLDKDAVTEFRWFPRSVVPSLKTLPGTREFVECLDRMERSATSPVSVRLERVQPNGRRDLVNMLVVRDLWGDLDFRERHVNVQSKSTHKRTARLSDAELSRALASRVRALARYGYTIAGSNRSDLSPIG